MKFPLGINKYRVTQKTENEDDSFQEDYVTKCMGAFGNWQALICPIACAGRLMVAWNIMSIVFLTPSTTFTCVKFKNDTDNINITEVKNSTCYADCLEYEYHSVVFVETLISRFGLICEKKWLQSFTQTAAMFGLVLGVSGAGWVSDRFGRRKAYLLTGLIAVVFTIASSFATSFWLFTSLRFIVGIGIGGVMTLCVVINIEIVGQKYRDSVGALSILPDGIGQVILAIIAYYVSTWHSLLLVHGLLSVVLVAMLFVVPDTPRWLVAQRRGDEAIAMMTKVAKFNKLSTAHIKETVDQAIEDMHNHQKELQKYHIADLFRTAYLTRITILCFMMWMGGGICFFGLNHYSTLLGLDIFVIVPLMGLLQILGPFLAVPVNKFLGRTVACVCAFCLVGVSMLALIFIPDGHWGCTATTGIGITSSIMLFSVMYVQVNELYPTPLRNMGLGISSSGAKIGAMIAPFIANTHPHWLASSIFTVIPFVASVFSMFVPETKGKQLKDTID